MLAKIITPQGEIEHELSDGFIPRSVMVPYWANIECSLITEDTRILWDEKAEQWYAEGSTPPSEWLKHYNCSLKSEEPLVYEYQEQ